MHTTFRVTSTTGTLLGIFPADAPTGMRALVEANPGAEVKSVVTFDNPCATHPAYEADNCPGCGTGARI